jgi:hypothetical protein
MIDWLRLLHHVFSITEAVVHLYRDPSRLQSSLFQFSFKNPPGTVNLRYRTKLILSCVSISVDYKTTSYS